MARLLPFPDLQIIKQEQLSGPESVSASTTRSATDFVQTVESPFGGWVYRFTFKPMTGEEYVHFRGWVTAMHRGANATRWQMLDRDLMSPALAGVSYASKSGQNWSNGLPWSNGQPWRLTYPIVSLAASTALNGTVISLANTFWGHSLKWGHRIGLSPFYFGMHQVTEVIAPGTYRVWPPVRKSFTSANYATLYPTLAMRMIGMDLPPADESRHSMNATVTLAEVFDYDCRDYFTA